MITYLVQNYFPRLSKACVGHKIADAYWIILGVIAHFQLMQFACCYYHEHVFTP